MTLNYTQTHSRSPQIGSQLPIRHVNLTHGSSRLALANVLVQVVPLHFLGLLVAQWEFRNSLRRDDDVGSHGRYPVPVCHFFATQGRPSTRGRVHDRDYKV
jgi:hypothetical protein